MRALLSAITIFSPHLHLQCQPVQQARRMRSVSGGTRKTARMCACISAAAACVPRWSRSATRLARTCKIPNPELRSRPIQGLVIMRGARKTGANTWKGQLYNTRDGKTYTGVVTVKSKKQLELEGCVLGGMLCQGVTWSRVR